MKKLSGFSLVEVLVFTAVLGLFFVAAMSVVTFNIKNMKIQEHKIIATRYAEEAVEWLKQEKEDDWSEFIKKDNNPSGCKTFCLNNLEEGWSHQVPPSCDYGLGTIYKRELLITNSSSLDNIDSIITVSWQDMGTGLSVPIKTVFKLLE